MTEHPQPYPNRTIFRNITEALNGDCWTVMLGCRTRLPVESQISSTSIYRLLLKAMLIYLCCAEPPCACTKSGGQTGSLKDLLNGPANSTTSH